MAGAFRVCEPSSKLLIEDFPAVNCFALARSGLLTEGARWILELGAGENGAPVPSQPATRRAGILEIGGQEIQIHSHRTIPAEVFVCPVCDKDRYCLSLKGGLWACRACHGLDYACRHRQTVPWPARIAFLRRRLHADPRPFTPLPVKRGRKHLALCREVRRLEAALITHARDDVVTEVASKRAVWLRYIDPDRITDNRNAQPVIFRSYGEGATAGAVHASLGVTLPEFAADEIGDCLPYPSPPSIGARQPYLLAIFGEKSSLDHVLRPLAQRYGANLYLASGELSDTLIRHMAKDAAEDPHGRPLVVLSFSDFDPAGTQMPVSIAWKLQALKVIEFPDLEFQVTPVSLTLDQVLAERLPTTPVKAGDARRDRWQAAYGPTLHEAGLIDDPATAAQVEIDALAALRPERLRAVTRAAIEGAYFDPILAERAAAARDAWREDAQTAIDRQIDPDEFELVREDAAEALTRLTDALNDLRACEDRLDELCASISLPEAPEPPEPEVDEDAQRPLADSEWGIAEVSRALRARKSYSDGDEE
jgi:hypothetical protein